MHNFPSKEEIIDAVIKGIHQAKTNYSHWTADELYLSNASEKFLSIHVSQEIGRLKNAPEIFIDATLADILRCSLSKRDAFKSYMKKNELSQDVMCLTLDERFEHKTDNDSISRVIMSIQNGVRNASDEYKYEIEKMCKMLKSHEQSTLDYGVFAFYLDISNSARKRSKKRLEGILKAFDEIVAEYKGLKSTFKGGEINIIENIGEWCVGCYIIEPTF